MTKINKNGLNHCFYRHFLPKNIKHPSLYQNYNQYIINWLIIYCKGVEYEVVPNYSIKVIQHQINQGWKYMKNRTFIKIYLDFHNIWVSKILFLRTAGVFLGVIMAPKT